MHRWAVCDVEDAQVGLKVDIEDAQVGRVRR